MVDPYDGIVPVTGDVCWCIHDGTIYVVRITEFVKQEYSGGTPIEYYHVTTERTTLNDPFYDTVKNRPRIVWRTTLFKFPEEAEKLREKCKRTVRQWQDWESAINISLEPREEVVCGVKIIDRDPTKAPELGQWYVDDLG